MSCKQAIGYDQQQKCREYYPRHQATGRAVASFTLVLDKGDEGTAKGNKIGDEKNDDQNLEKHGCPSDIDDPPSIRLNRANDLFPDRTL